MLTTMVLLLAQLPFVKSLTGSTVMGNYLILLFLACNGAKSVIAKIVEVGPEVFYLATGTVRIPGVAVGDYLGLAVGRMMEYFPWTASKRGWIREPSRGDDHSWPRRPARSSLSCAGERSTG